MAATPSVERAPAVSGEDRRHWSLRYPPIILALIGVVVAAIVLPSALNIPQTNPTETAEYAPVPPTDQNAPPGGNFSSLGLGSSSTLQGTGSQPAGSDQGDQGPLNHTVITVPSGFRCTGTPPRQTEDPLSPPCVAYYGGSNGGATYGGVTSTEIRVIVYMDGGNGQSGPESPTLGDSCYFNSGESVARPPDTYFDFDKDTKHSSSNPNYPEGMSDYATGMRMLDIFFNQHFQLYHRHVHMLLWHGRLPQAGANPGGQGYPCDSAADRQADAAEQIQAFHPFAVLDYSGSNQQTYEQYMNAHGVVTFITQSPLSTGSLVGRDASDFQHYPGLVWSYVPTVQTAADWSAKWICKQIVAPGKVTFSGNNDLGSPRKYGFIRANDPDHPLLNEYGQLVENEVKACGANVVAPDILLPRANYNIVTPSRSNPTSNTYAEQGIANFRLAGVTTVLWGGGDDNNPPAVANSDGYVPEWVIAGDRFFETGNGGFYQNQAEWAHAFIDSQVELVPGQYQQECYLAYTDADPNAKAPGQFESNVACDVYNDFRLLFTGLQIAGPHLDPPHLDQGFHAIPRVASTNPGIPTCYFDPGDYTCIKDAEFEYWNANKFSPDSNSAGCYQMVKGGKRWLGGNWDAGDVMTYQDKANDPCNDYHF